MNSKKDKCVLTGGIVLPSIGELESCQNIQDLANYSEKNKIKIKPGWGATLSIFGKPEAYRIGPILKIKRNEHTRLVPFLERVELCVTAEDLEKLIEEQGLEMARNSGFYDCDAGMITEEWYRFTKK